MTRGDSCSFCLPAHQSLHCKNAAVLDALSVECGYQGSVGTDFVGPPPFRDHVLPNGQRGAKRCGRISIITVASPGADGRRHIHDGIVGPSAWVDLGPDYARWVFDVVGLSIFLRTEKAIVVGRGD